MKYTVKICKRTGVMEFLGTPPPRMVLPLAKRTRFSEIVPVRPQLWWLFRFIRWACGEDSKAGEWTRRWRCLWVAEILQGKHRGRVNVGYDRAGLVEWERNIWRQS